MSLRVVVTGIGAITPLGLGCDISWSNILNSRSGVKRIPADLFSTEVLSTKIAGIVPDFNAANFMDSREVSKMDRFIHLAIAASKIAIEDAGWKPSNDEDREDTAVVIGSGIGGLPCIERNLIKMLESGPRKVSPFFIPSVLANLPAGWVSILHNFTGPNLAPSTACATGAHAIIDAARLIKNGESKVAIAGGTEASVCPIGIAAFNAARALSTKHNDSPQIASRPWDKDRDGFVMSEGAGILVLEEYEHAKKRGAKIYAELRGYGLTGDAYHITAPAENGHGGIKAMQKAIQMAKVDHIDYINAHATSTLLGDKVEIYGIKRILELYPGASISSTKGAIGHLLGAAGAVEAIFSILAIRDQVAPHTLNLNNLDDEIAALKLDLVVNQPKERIIHHTLSNSFGFGGTNASLVFSAIEQ